MFFKFFILLILESGQVDLFSYYKVKRELGPKYSPERLLKTDFESSFEADLWHHIYLL